MGNISVSSEAVVNLFRVENPQKVTTRPPNGTTSHEDLVGQWFSPNLTDALAYLRKSTQRFAGSKPQVVDGTQLVIAQVPTDKLAAFHVSAHPVASGMDVEGSNYVLPRDGSVPTIVLPLDETLGELRGHLGQTENYAEASRRVQSLVEHAGHLALAERPPTT